MSRLRAIPVRWRLALPSAVLTFAILALFATVIGLRPNATAIPVPIVTRSVCSAISACGRNGSCAVSAVHSPS